MTQQPPSLRYLPHLDGLRATAVLLVLVCHFRLFHGVPWLAEFGYSAGALGVDLFFVLSGFLITQILLAARARAAVTGVPRRSALKAFYARRVLRIFPAYLTLVAILYAIGDPATHDQLGWVLTYTLNLNQAWSEQTQLPIHHFWSLAVEEQFYLVWPLLALTLPRRAAVAVTCMAILHAEAFRVFAWLDGRGPNGIRFHTLACLDGLGWGALLAQLRLAGAQRAERWLGRYGLWIGLPVTLLLAVQPFPNYAFWIHVGLFDGPLCFWLVAKCSLDPSSRWRILTVHPLTSLGRISYGIYLYHLPVACYAIGYLPGDGARVATQVQFLIFTPLTLTAAAASYHLVERPLNRLKERWPMIGKPPVPEEDATDRGEVDARQDAAQDPEEPRPREGCP